MWLVVGLGNPGERYAQTRHNIGFDCVATLAERHGISLRTVRGSAIVGEGQIGGQRVALALPQTFMNESGRAVSALRSWYKIDPARELIVVYDDLDLPFSAIRMREQGSAGTHNGMRSIVAQLGSGQFPRLRVGIGRPPGKMEVASFVLARFSREEEPEIPLLRSNVADALEMVIGQGLIAAMNKYNR